MDIRESGHPNIFYMEVDGRLTGEDVEKAEVFMNEHYKGVMSLDAIIDVKNVDGLDISGLIKGSLVDIKHWKQYGKFAIITESAWLEKGTHVSNILPGIELKQFDRAQRNEAWEWLKN